MYVVTHGGLSAGQQTAQVAHALAEFACERGDHFTHWHETSNYFIALQEPSPVELENLLEEALREGLDFVCFREPDRSYELTAIAFVPCVAVKRFLGRLPLAGKDFVERASVGQEQKKIDHPKKGVSISDAPSLIEGVIQ